METKIYQTRFTRALRSNFGKAVKHQPMYIVLDEVQIVTCTKLQRCSIRSTWIIIPDCFSV